MKCPVDGVTLALAERHGVEIDYCPQCRGIWLDRGELDRIIERSATQPVRAEERSHPHEADYRHEADHGDRHQDDGRHHDDDKHHDDGRHHDEDRYSDAQHTRPGRKRGGAFSALTGLLGGED